MHAAVIAAAVTDHPEMRAVYEAALADATFGGLVAEAMDSLDAGAVAADREAVVRAGLDPAVHVVGASDVVIANIMSNGA